MADKSEKVYESTISKAWECDRDDGSDKLICFMLDDVSNRAFWGQSDWLPLLQEAISLRTRVRVSYSIPEPVSCGDPFCGDGCCDDPECTNFPENERESPFLVRCDDIMWL
ncbi:hypothetical protein [Streptomyces sp. UNOC14_S4]|uniref:hypothetical protein n=1 Tax=Streptomyces sp. UNOC14_S4 TaxID=2872340 RepID=UPI001E6028E1|nr:hypothetical protein [Streptomyces sp. UNOC14_S4]MCC3766495.1 hypothetical protein [Streptomyces sp. UNOC14_S4]